MEKKIMPFSLLAQFQAFTKTWKNNKFEILSLQFVEEFIKNTSSLLTVDRKCKLF